VVPPGKYGGLPEAWEKGRLWLDDKSYIAQWADVITFLSNFCV